jgi:hypothetical protein
MATSRERLHRHVPSVHYDDEGLLGVRRAAAYNPTEQDYSMLLYKRIEQLLKGQRNDLLILRKYPSEPDRLGTMPTPAELDREALRIDRVERMATDVLVFLSARAPGGPIAQQIDTDGRLSEIRKYPTRFPHIIIERLDRYESPDHELPEYIQWQARRVQNQRRNMRVNQMLDIANLSLEAARLFIP